jgi:hypothetical protein
MFEIKLKCAVLIGLASVVAAPTGCSVNDDGLQNDIVAIDTGTGCVSPSSKLLASTVFADPSCLSDVLLQADDCQLYFACSFHRDAPIGVCNRDRQCPER